MKKIIKYIKCYFLSLLHIVYVYLVGWIKPRHRSLIYYIYDRSIENDYKPEYCSIENPIIPEISIENLVSEKLEIRMESLEETGGNISTLELCCINKLVKSYNPQNTFEIGTFNGRTTLNIAANSSIEAKIYTIDLPKQMLNNTKLDLLSNEVGYVNKESSGEKFVGSGFENIVQLYGDSASYDFSEYQDSMDMVFVDGSHAYDYVRNDTENALKLLRAKGGIIIWHDYGKEYLPYQGVTKALNEYYCSGGIYAGLQHVKNTSLVILELAEFK